MWARFWLVWLRQATRRMLRVTRTEDGPNTCSLVTGRR
jgi:hypothetical protein